jgi:leader peptidase (prepilin peptidase)/N-methyltransferase
LPPALTTFIILWLFVLGCVVGSFLNVLIWRLPRGFGMGSPRRSICPNCEHPIRWYDNIPVLSFLVLGARCRDCAEPISWRYPLVEALTGLLFALVYWQQGVQVGAGADQITIMLLAVCLLIVGSAIDMEWLIIPDEITIFGLLGGLAAGLMVPSLHVGAAPYHTFDGLTGFYHLDGLVASLIGALGGGLMVVVFAIIGAVIFLREAMGFGDVKLMAMLGAFFGWKFVVVAFFIAPFVGLLYGIPLLVMNDEHVMPYGPFLSIGALIAIIFRSNLCRYLEPLEYLAGLLLG